MPLKRFLLRLGHAPERQRQLLQQHEAALYHSLAAAEAPVAVKGAAVVPLKGAQAEAAAAVKGAAAVPLKGATAAVVPMQARTPERRPW